MLDIDGIEGANSIEGLYLPEAPTVVTARGHHYYFKFPNILKETSTTRVGLLPGVDTRGRGGFIVAPPSIHPSGHQYQWRNQSYDFLPDPPAWLIERLTSRKRMSYKKPVMKSRKLSNYVKTSLRNEYVAVKMAPEGTRNSRLNQAAFSMGTLIAAGLVQINWVAVVLAQAGLNAGLCKSEVEKTLQSGLSAGMKHPREVTHG